MSGDTIFVFSVVGVASVLFASGRVRLDIVALLVVLALALGGVLSPRQALAGFGDPVVIMVAGLLVVSEMLTRTGIAVRIGNWISRVGGDSETRLLLLLMVTAAVLSALMSSTAVVAIFVPVVLNVAAKANLNASRLLMPLSYAALIGGMLTLIATPPNIVVAAELDVAGYTPFGFFAFTPIGAAVLVVAMLYMFFIGRRLLTGEGAAPPATAARSAHDLMTEFGLGEQVQRLEVPAGSPLVGQSLGEIEMETRFGVRGLLLERGERFRRAILTVPAADTILRANDVLVVADEAPAVDKLVAELGLERQPVSDQHHAAWLNEIGVATVLVHPESQVAGRSVREVGFRTRYGLQVLGLRRKDEVQPDALGEHLEVGDTLLVLGPWNRIANLQGRSHDFVVLTVPAEMETVAPAQRRAPLALVILGLMVVLAAFQIVPVVLAVIMAALAAVGGRCLSMEQAYRAIHWASLVLIAGMLPIADALEMTGGVDLIVDGLVYGLGDAGPYVMMSALFFLTAGLGLFLSNTASAVLVAPIAIRAAEALDVTPYCFAMAVAIAASAAFVTPVSTPVVTLVVAPGHYRFMDFVKIGGPLLILTWLVTLAITPLIYPF